MPDFALITTCRGRLHHLKQTLPGMAALKPDELIVVDYGCPDGTGAWVEKTLPAAKIVSVEDNGEFSASHARNLGATAASCDWLLFVDADVHLDARLGDWLRDNVEQGAICRVEREGLRRDLEKFGTFACARSDFEAVGGFDEALKGWSGENFDLFARLGELDLAERDYPADYVEPIRHDDSERAGFEGLRGRDERVVQILCYTEAKRQIRAIMDVPGELPLAQREDLREAILTQLREWLDAGAQGKLEITYRLDRPIRFAPPPYMLASTSVVAFELSVNELDKD